MSNTEFFIASHVLLEGEVNPEFPSYLSPRRICSLRSIPVTNYKSNDEREMALVNMKYFTIIQNAIDELILSEGLNCLNKIQFKNASLIFSYIKKSSGKTFIKDEPYFEFYKRDNKVYSKTFKGERLKSPMLIKTNLNKLADFHELDEIESDYGKVFENE